MNWAVVNLEFLYTLLSDDKTSNYRASSTLYRRTQTLFAKRPCCPQKLDSLIPLFLGLSRACIGIWRTICSAKSPYGQTVLRAFVEDVCLDKANGQQNAFPGIWKISLDLDSRTHETEQEILRGLCRFLERNVYSSLIYIFRPSLLH